MLFVDINNVYYCVQKKFEGRKLDYGKYYDKACNLCNLSGMRAIAYGFQVKDEAQSFITCLRKLGYSTRYKKPRIIGDNKFKRMDWNIGIAVDVFGIIDRTEQIVIGSSDPELAPLIEWLRTRGIETIIFSSIIPTELKTNADKYFEITEDLLEEESCNSASLTPSPTSSETPT